MDFRIFNRIYFDHDLQPDERERKKEVIILMTLFSCQFLVRALFFVSFTVIVTHTGKKEEEKEEEGRGGAAVSVIWWRMCGQLPDKL